MKEIQQIIAEADKARASGKTAALATVVGIQGSGYRLPGARMLIVDNHWVAGSVSGGCLEEDVILRAADAVRKDQAMVTTYDTTGDDDIVFGVGLGCKGIITILIEPIRARYDGKGDLLEFIKACQEQRVPGIVATVVRVEGQVDTQAGCRVLARAGTRISDVKDAELKDKIFAAIERQSFAQSSSSITVAVQNGTVEMFVERVDPPTPLIIFGAGHDALPLVRLAHELGWHVTLVDHRPAYATAARFPSANRIVVATPEEALSKISLGPDTLAIVMTHNYLRDAKLLELLLPTAVRYIGLLGPSKRTETMLDELRQGGAAVGPGELGRLYAPVGLDLGSESPAEVALSIVSEMQSVITNHSGGSLRDRKSPIHSRGTGSRGSSLLKV